VGDDYAAIVENKERDTRGHIILQESNSSSWTYVLLESFNFAEVVGGKSRCTVVGEGDGHTSLSSKLSSAS